MTGTPQTARRRAIVIGGSLGGLFAGTMLEQAGWDVDIYERSPHDLDSRGGGIVLQPDVVEILRRAGHDMAGKALGVRSRFRTVFRPDGAIESKLLAPQTQTSWSLVYAGMKSALGDARYHPGKELVAVRSDPQLVTAVFQDGSERTGDLLIGADGGNSTVRRLLWPDAAPSYAGYLAWRGLVPEGAMPALARDALLGDFSFANDLGSHILGYLVPGEHNDTRQGHRLYNWVWYRVADQELLRSIMTDKDGQYRGYAMPEGFLAPRWREHLYSDASALPPGFRAIVSATEQPFAQAIRDLAVDSMVKERVILVGDAAFIPRPHTAASTAKAAANALALADALGRFPGDLRQALEWWQPQQLELGRSLYRQGRRAGDALLFGRPPVDQR